MSEHTDLEQCVRDERWDAAWAMLHTSEASSWVVYRLAGFGHHISMLYVASGDTILAAANAALRTKGEA